MEIVVKISEDVYTRLFDNGIQDNEIATDDICEMARALRLGKPLPKWHGRLIDADELRRTMEKDVRKAMSFVDLADFVWLAPTIIEAEKE